MRRRWYSTQNASSRTGASSWVVSYPRSFVGVRCLYRKALKRSFCSLEQDVSRALEGFAYGFAVTAVSVCHLRARIAMISVLFTSRVSGVEPVFNSRG